MALSDYKKKEIGAELGRMLTRLREIADELECADINISTNSIYVQYSKGLYANIWEYDVLYGDQSFENLLTKQPTISPGLLIDELEEASKKWGFEFPLSNGEVMKE